MRIAIDGTPLLGPRTGIGRYVGEILSALGELPVGGPAVQVAAFTVRGARQLPGLVPPPATALTRPLPARPLQWAWGRGELPTVTSLVGRVDVFHGTNFVLPPTGSAAGVVTVHDLAYLHLPELVSDASRRYRELVPRSVRRARVVCVPSAAVAAELAEAYPAAADRTTVTPLGVSRRWTAEPPTPAPARVHLLFVGTVEPRKGLPTLLDALRVARARGADVPPLVIAGPAGWGPPLDLHGLPASAVRQIGHVPEDELIGLVDSAVAVVFPSVYEGFGLPVLEAFARGTPVVASDIPTTRELADRVPGAARLFPVGDPGALAELLASAGTTEDTGPGRRRRALAREYTWARTVEQTLAAWRTAAG